MRTIYVEAKSKKSVNERLTAGENVPGVEYAMFNETFIPSTEWQAGDVIKIFSKRVNGTPYAKAYGQVVVKDVGTRLK